MTTLTTTELMECFPKSGERPGNGLIPSPVNQRAWLIDGELLDWTGPVRTVWSPIHTVDELGVLHQIVLGTIPHGGFEEAEDALRVAEEAYDGGKGLWPTMSTAGRIKAVMDFVSKIAEQRERIVNLLMWEIAKSRSDSEKEFDRTIQYINATITELQQLENDNSKFHLVDGIIAQIRRSPLGVVLCMGPYNYPLNETFCTLIPALLMGNVVVFKPPRFGVLLYNPMLEAFRSSFPAGAINIVYGQGSTVIPHIMGTGKINALALIGSSRVADQLKKAHPKSNRLRAVLGLDAKNTAIILPDADLSLTLSECVTGALSFNGQRCTAIKMIWVHRSLADEFVNQFSAAVNQLKIGMPWDKGVVITPLPELGKVEQMTDYVNDAVRFGAKVVNVGGGECFGTLFHPAVLYPINEQMRVYREEQFGPVVPIAVFDDMDEPLKYVVTSNYGQQVSVFGQDADQVASLVDILVNQVSRVNINSQCQRGPDVFPFTGRKDSAEGTLSVHDALRSFSIRTMIAAKNTADNKYLLEKIVKERRSSFIHTNFLI